MRSKRTSSLPRTQKFKTIMATGDMKNNLMKLLREVRRMKIGVEPDVQSLSTGSPSAFLSLLHAAVMHYSLPLANWFTQHGYDLYGRSDLRFLQELYRVLRDVFNYRPKLTKEQFLSVGFAERKVLMTRDVLLFCQAKNSELTGHVNSNRVTAKRRRAQSSSKPFGNHSNATTAPKRPPDVLTIQERSGVGSAWCESTRNFKVDEPSSPPSMAPPPSVAPPLSFNLPHSVPVPTNELDVTLTSSPPPHLRSSSPHLLSSTPPLLSFSPTHDEPEQQDTSSESITARVVRHDSPHSDTESPLPTSNEVGGPLPMSNERKDQEIGVEEKRDTSPPSLESWSSLPERRGDERATVKEGGHRDDFPEVVGSRVEQLTKMVEKLSAKFVLLETQLKLSQPQPGQRSVEPDHSSCHESVSFRERTEEGEKKKDGERGVGGVKQPLKDITDKQVVRQPHPSLSIEPHPTPLKSFVSSEQTPPHSEATPPYSLLRRRDLVHHYTAQSSHSLTLHMTTPSTPEETNGLIESLRARAKETKEFLHLANSRLIQTAQQLD